MATTTTLSAKVSGPLPNGVRRCVCSGSSNSMALIGRKRIPTPLNDAASVRAAHLTAVAYAGETNTRHPSAPSLRRHPRHQPHSRLAVPRRRHRGHGIPIRQSPRGSKSESADRACSWPRSDRRALRARALRKSHHGCPAGRYGDTAQCESGCRTNNTHGSIQWHTACSERATAAPPHRRYPSLDAATSVSSVTFAMEFTACLWCAATRPEGAAKSPHVNRFNAPLCMPQTTVCSSRSTAIDSGSSSRQSERAVVLYRHRLNTATVPSPLCTAAAATRPTDRSVSDMRVERAGRSHCARPPQTWPPGGSSRHAQSPCLQCSPRCN